MSYMKKIGFIRGLISGLELDGSTPERKVLLALTDALESIADHIEEMEETLDAVADVVSESMRDSMDGDPNMSLIDNDDFDGDDDEYELECPNCKNTVIVEDSDIENGSFKCKFCGKTVEIYVHDCGGECDHKHDHH